MPSSPQDFRSFEHAAAQKRAASHAARPLTARGAEFVLRHRRVILPVMALVLAAVEGIKLLLFGPHHRPAVLILDLLILAVISLLVGLLVAALEHSETEHARAAGLASAAAEERKQVAQILHDTVAQNISYLRLKLDQITGDDGAKMPRGREISGKDLSQMREAAEEAYFQMRMTLDELNPIPLQDITSMINRQAGIVAQRAGFKARTTQIGAPYTLPGPVCQQILYIIREALHNVEKHARAKTVHVQLVWLEKELILKVTDDGTGMLPDEAHEDGHYGLWIMRHRATEIGGTVTVQPADSRGTEVTLWLPRPASPVPAGTNPIPRSAGCEY